MDCSNVKQTMLKYLKSLDVCMCVCVFVCVCVSVSPSECVPE